MKDFKKYFIIKAPPEEIYQAITNQKSIELWTGETAVMSEEVGTEFSLWDESITGRNLEFESDKKIVQEWFFGDQTEPSIVTIKLHLHKKGTSVELVHTNIPEADYVDFVEGWEESYFAGIKEFVEDDGED